jgi:hypothetical protein
MNCGNCAFWRGWAVRDDYGDCKFLRAGEHTAQYIYVYDIDNRIIDQHEEPFGTHRDFGCVHFVSREEDE